MNTEEIKSYSIDQVEKRMEEIRSMNLDKVENIDEISKEVDALQERRKALKNEAKAKKDIRTKILNREVETTLIEKPQEERKMDFDKMSREEILATKEYRNAVLKRALGKELTETEKRAASHVYTTGDHSVPLPTTLANEIWDLIAESHAILGDITSYRTGTILELTKVVSIEQGKGKKVAEGTSNDDLKTTEVKVTLTGNDYSAVVELSYAEKKMSIDAFEQYLKDKIVEECGNAMAKDAISKIKESMNARNKVTAAKSKYEYTDITNTYAKVKRAKRKVVYVNNETYYGQLCGMVDTTGRPIFQPNAQAEAEGILLGAVVKVEEALGDNELLVGDPKRVVANVIEDIMLESDKDIKNHKYIHSAYAREEFELMDDLSFALLQTAA